MFHIFVDMYQQAIEEGREKERQKNETEGRRQAQRMNAQRLEGHAMMSSFNESKKKFFLCNMYIMVKAKKKFIFPHKEIYEDAFDLGLWRLKRDYITNATIEKVNNLVRDMIAEKFSSSLMDEFSISVSALDYRSDEEKANDEKKIDQSKIDELLVQAVKFSFGQYLTELISYLNYLNNIN